MKKGIFFFFLFVSTLLSGQKDPMKWGKISQAEVDLNIVEFDSSASAVVLCDYGKINVTRGGGVIIRRHTRIKILKEDGKDYANVLIPFYHKGGSEQITTNHAQTINIINGKPEMTKVGKKDFFKVKRNEAWSELRFTFPEVQVGSIIEYSYTTASENYTNLESWIFQNDIPTIKSQVFANIGAGLNYNIMFQGRNLINKYRGKTVNTWSLENLPAIEDEPYCPNPFDYIEKLKFQLASYQGQGGMVSVMTNWKSVAADLYNQTGMKQYLKSSKSLNAIVAEVTNEEDSEEMKIQKIYDHVTRTIKWNKKYRLIPQETFKQFRENKSGNSAEVNLYFINLLKCAGLDAKPTLISTKKHGLINKNITFYSQFNHIIAHVRIIGKDLLVDATNKHRHYTQLDEEDLNGEGLVMHKKKPFWVALKSSISTKIVKLVTMKIPEPGKLNYTYQVNAKGYEALKIREQMSAINSDVASYFNKVLIKENSSYKISKEASKNLEEKSKAVSLSADILDESQSMVNEDFLYINPFIDAYYESNPFNAKNRYLPIDFYFPFEEAYILNFTVPEGYEIIEYPQPLNLMTQGKKAIFKFNSSLNGDQLQLRIVFAIKNPFFTSLDYPVLREIYDRYIEKRAEQIVLKKKI